MTITFRRMWLPVLLLLLCSCEQTNPSAPGRETGKTQKEILIYCGITMTQPVMELAALVEKEKGCRVKMTYGESQWLKDTALATRTGDVYFPGSPLFLKSMVADKTVVETVEVGESRIVFMVKKGNPQKIKADLRELLRNDIKIVLGDPDKGSIGRETKISLDKMGIYSRVLDRVLYLTPDSKGLAQAIRQGDADVVVNWKALAVLKENAQQMDIITLPAGQTEKRTLTMGRLSFSKHDDLAKYFLKRATSEEGRAIFNASGF